MTNPPRTRVPLLVALLVLLSGVAGCATNPGSPGSASVAPPSTVPVLESPAPSSSTRIAIPTVRSGPYTSLPSDLITGLWLLGTVSRGGPGPCYGFEADDGREYSLSGATVGPLATGDRIRVRVIAAEQPVDCGSGEPMIVLEIKRAG